MRIAVDDRTVELRSGVAVPVTLPPGFTIYPGAEIIRNTRVERDGRQLTLVEFETTDPLAKVVLFHRAQAQAAGVSLTLDIDGTSAASIGGRTALGGDFALTARRGSDRTIVELSVDDPAAGADQ